MTQCRDRRVRRHELLIKHTRMVTQHQPDHKRCCIGDYKHTLYYVFPEERAKRVQLSQWCSSQCENMDTNLVCRHFMIQSNSKALSDLRSEAEKIFTICCMGTIGGSRLQLESSSLFLRSQITKLQKYYIPTCAEKSQSVAQSVLLLQGCASALHGRWMLCYIICMSFRNCVDLPVGQGQSVSKLQTIMYHPLCFCSWIHICY